MHTPGLLLSVGVTFLACLSPGPNVLLVVSFSLKQGIAPAARAVLGSTLANATYLTLAAIGLIALIAASKPLFTAVRYFGAAYLIYVGVSMLRSNWRRSPVQSPALALRPCPLLQGLLTHLSNPKGILYWSALLPQFLGHSRPLSEQILALGSIGILLDLVVLLGYAALAASARRLIQGSRFFRWIDRIAGCFFVAAGVVLLGSARVGPRSA